MKLRQGGEARVNRSPRATEVLRTPEQPWTKLWDQRDPQMLAEYLRVHPKHHSENATPFVYSMFDLEVMQPGSIPPKEREREVELLLERMEMAKNRWSYYSFDDSVKPVTKFLFPAVLLDPSRVTFKAPQKFTDALNTQLELLAYWPTDALRMSAVLFPEKLKPVKDHILQKLQAGLISAREHSPNKGHEIADIFATARLVAPERFAELEMTNQDREEILKHLTKCRCEDEVKGWEKKYPQELFLAMVALADQVTVSKDKGLQLEFAPTAVAPTSALPQRPSF